MNRSKSTIYSNQFSELFTFSDMSINSQGGPPQLEVLGPYSVQYTDEEILVNGPAVMTCQEIARDIQSGKKTVVTVEGEQFLVGTTEESDEPAANVDPEAVADKETENNPPTVSSSAGNKVNSRSKSQKPIKTEYANSWIQFCRIKKNKAILDTGDKDATYDLKESKEEWKQMSKEEKAFYVELAKAEKNSLGDHYRAGRSRKKAETDVKAPKQRGKRTTKPKEPKQMVGEKLEDTSSAAVRFLEQLEDVDEQIDAQEFMNDTMAEELEREKVALAISQFKLDIKSEELEKSKEKLNMLVKQHASCSSQDS